MPLSLITSKFSILFFIFTTSGGKGESLSTSMILIDGEENQGSAVSLTQQGTTPRPGIIDPYNRYNSFLH